MMVIRVSADDFPPEHFTYIVVLASWAGITLTVGEVSIQGNLRAAEVT